MSHEKNESASKPVARLMSEADFRESQALVGSRAFQVSAAFQASQDSAGFRASRAFQESVDSAAFRDLAVSAAFRAAAAIQVF